MNIQDDQIERIKELGYTEAEARFIYIVAIHSGYFTLRQFLNFTQAKRGKRSNAFAQKLLKHGHATMRDYVRKHGFVRSYSGRVRHLPMIASPDEMTRSEAERQAINSPVQEFGSSLGVMACGRITF